MAGRKPPPPALSLHEVSVRSTWDPENEPTRVNKALAYFDTAARDLAPREALLDALNLDYQVDVERLLGLDIDDPRLRLRAIAVRAYERLIEFRAGAYRVMERDDLRAELEQLTARLVQRNDHRLHPAIIGLSKSVKALQPRVNRLIDPRLDLLWDAGLEAQNDGELREAVTLLDLLPDGRPVINESVAARYGDLGYGNPELVTALRDVMASFDVGPVELDDDDFHVLQLGEIYALSFGKRVPTTYHPELDGADAAFLAFVEANFGLADMPITSPEHVFGHWRKFPGLRSRLSRLTQLGAAAVGGAEPPFYLEERRELGSIGILEDLEAMSSF